MTVIDELFENAAAYGESFDQGALPLPPAKRVAVVACMDARLNPYGLLGLAEGDAHVIREERPLDDVQTAMEDVLRGDVPARIVFRP